MHVRGFLPACAVLAMVAAMSPHLAAQAVTQLSGRLVNSLSGEPIAGATVSLEELKRETTSGPDGTFTFENVPPGSYHLAVRAQGLFVTTHRGRRGRRRPARGRDRRSRAALRGSALGQSGCAQSVRVLPADVGPRRAGAVETARDVAGRNAESQPGVASRSFGPAPARPVVRGLDGDRVLILQDGQRMGDLSSQSGDHGVQINPAAAQRIEVVRGPATLLYGANAIGGLVNVITDEIPTKPMMGTSGNFTFDLGSAAKEAAAAGDVHVGNGTFALHVGGGGSRSGDVATPEGDLENSQSRNGFGNVGLSWTGTKGYFGGNYGYDDTKYGIPVVEEGQVQLTPRRHAFSLRAGANGLSGAIDSYRATLAIRRYKHDELEGEEVGTAFTQQHRRSRSDGLAPRRRATEGQRRRLVPRTGRSTRSAKRRCHRRSISVASRHSSTRKSRGRTSRSSSVAVSITRGTNRTPRPSAASRPGRARSACCCGRRRRTIASPSRSAWRVRRGIPRSKSCSTSVRTLGTSLSKSAILT